MIRTYRRVFQAARSLVLQPHRDDAVMNAAILLLAGMIPLPAAIVSVFSRSSHLVRALPARSIGAVSEIRKREDVLAWRGFPGVHLVNGMGFLDLPDRDPSGSETILTWKVERAIERLVLELGITFLVVQYAARPDSHPDHQVVFRAAERVASELANVTLLLIQDAPYSVIDPGSRALLDRDYRPVLVPLSARALRRKHLAMEAYPSQMRPQFHSFVDRHRWEALWVPEEALVRRSRLLALERKKGLMESPACPMDATLVDHQRTSKRVSRRKVEFQHLSAYRCSEVER